MLTEPNYRGFSIEAYAELSDGYWDATVKIRRLIPDQRLRVERISCRKVTAALAETRAAIWGKRWVDQYSTDREPATRLA